MTIKKLVMASLILSLMAGCGSNSSDVVTITPPPAPPSLSQQVSAIVQPQLNNHPDLPLGVAVGVVQPGSGGAISTNLFFFGKLIDENGNPLSLDGGTEFEIGSVTKTFTATILAALAQKQSSVLATPTNTIFPTTPTFSGTQTTILDLANYTSGLPDSNRGSGTGTCTFQGGTITDCYDLTQLFINLADPTLSALQFAPGTSYLYSDLGYALLALAEPVLAGSTTTDPLDLLEEWEGMLDSMVLTPLGMNATHAFNPSTDPGLLPQGYRHESSGNIDVGLGHNNSWPSFIGAGGIVSTPSDMMIYLEYSLGLLNSPLNGLLSALHTPTTKVTTPSGEQLGIGWFIGTLPGSSISFISKNGGVPAFSTQIDFAPSTNTGVIVLANVSADKGVKKLVDVTTTASQVLQIINGLPVTSAGPSDDQP